MPVMPGMKAVGTNTVGFLGTPDPRKGVRPLAGFEQNFNRMLAGHDGTSSYQVGSGVQAGRQRHQRQGDVEHRLAGHPRVLVTSQPPRAQMPCKAAPPPLCQPPAA